MQYYHGIISKEIISSHALRDLPYSKMKIEIFNSETLSKNLLK